MKILPGGLLIAAVFAILAFGVWAFLNSQGVDPPWPHRIQGFAFSPFRANEDPTRQRCRPLTRSRLGSETAGGQG
jgi:hypothetical protein